MTILEFFDKADALHVAVIIFRNVSPLLAGFWKESLPDVVVNRLLGNPGLLHQLSNFQEFSSLSFKVADGKIICLEKGKSFDLVASHHQIKKTSLRPSRLCGEISLRDPRAFAVKFLF